MAYKTKFLHFKTKASYEAERAKTTAGSEERKVFDAYISFIDEGPTICTWGKEYQCDANSLSLLPQEVTTEKQDQVFKNLGWKVHVISQSDINAITFPNAAEKTKRLEATTLLVKETSLIYVRGNDDSNNHYFFKINSSSQLELIRININTGIIYSINSQFIDAGTIRYDRTQTLSDSNKTLARENIDAANKNDVLPLTIDLNSQTVEDYNTALEAFNSKKPLTILDSTDPAFRFTANVIEKEVTADDINVYFSFTGLDDVNALNTVGYVETIKPTGEKISSFAAIMPSNTYPKPLGQASPGTDNAYSRSDHVHPIQESVAKLTTPRTIALTGVVSGSTTFDGSSNVSINSTLANIDASKITSGTLNADRLPNIPIEKLPAGALERMFVMESQNAAINAVKTGTIQEGDVVQIGSKGLMYFCIDDAATTFGNAFKEFTAVRALSVSWSGVTGKPTFATVATSGSYNDLSNKPTIPSLSGYATQSWVTSQGYLTSVPVATSSAYGGIQIGYTTSGKNYAVQLSNGKAYVNVPWTDTNTTYTAGTNISISGTTINCTYSYSLPTATASVLGGVKIGSNISVSSGTISLTSANVTSALGFTPAKTSDIPEIPIALPNPYALTINGTSYTGSSAVSISTSKPLSVRMLTSSTVNAGYSYSCGISRAISTLNGFSSTNPDSVIISSAKLKFTASNVIKMDGLDDLSGTWYIYCLSYMANSKIAVNGAVYA